MLGVPELMEVARSGFPSPLKSATATPAGKLPVVKLPASTKLPMPVARKTVTELPLLLETMMSLMPSPLTSATATPSGPDPAVKGRLVRAEKAPPPTLSRTLTVSLPVFVTTRSGLPSPFTSPIATSEGLVPTAYLTGAKKVPAPFASRTEILFAPLFTTTTSGLPSPFRSPVATKVAPVPVVQGEPVTGLQGLDAVSAVLRPTVKQKRAQATPITPKRLFDNTSGLPLPSFKFIPTHH